MTTAHPHTAARPPGEDAAQGRRWLILALLCLAQFMLVLDVTAVNVALPSIGRDLGVGTGALSWTITAYVVAFGGSIMLGGRLADSFGRRRMLVIGLLVFAAGSALCGLATDIGWLIASRVGQGLGAALISPAALAVVPALFTGRQRGRALGAWAGVGASGFAAGLMVGGALTVGPGWPWLFLVNVPIALAIAPALGRLLPALPGTRDRVDLLGALLVSVFAAALVYALTTAGDRDVHGGWTLLAAGASIVALILFLLRQRGHGAPLMPLHTLRRRPVVSGLVIMLLASGAMLSTFLLTSLQLQREHGLDPLQTGLACLPAAVATFLGAHVAGRLLGAASVRVVTASSLALAGVGALLLAWASGVAAMWPLVAGLVLACVGLGAAFVTATSTALRHVDGAETGLVSGIVNTGHELGGAVGIAAVVAVVASGPLSPGYLAVAIGLLAAVLASPILVAPGRATVPAGGHGHVH